MEAEIERMRERNARIITREGKAQDGDVTDIDFEGFVDGVAFEGGEGEHFSLTLGSGQPVFRALRSRLPAMRPARSSR